MSEKKEVPRPQPSPPQLTALTTGLSKQMSDVIFKLDTLTSRVVLIENRLMMVEARVCCDCLLDIFKLSFKYEKLILL